MANIIQTFPKGNGIDLSIIADEFDDTKSYAVNDRCIKDKILYECITPHTGVWNAADFTSITLDDVIPVPMNTSDVDDIISHFNPGTGIIAPQNIQYFRVNKSKTITINTANDLLSGESFKIITGTTQRTGITATIKIPITLIDDYVPASLPLSSNAIKAQTIFLANFNIALSSTVSNVPANTMSLFRLVLTMEHLRDLLGDEFFETNDYDIKYIIIPRASAQSMDDIASPGNAISWFAGNMGTGTLYKDKTKNSGTIAFEGTILRSYQYNFSQPGFSFGFAPAVIVLEPHTT